MSDAPITAKMVDTPDRDFAMLHALRIVKSGYRVDICKDCAFISEDLFTPVYKTLRKRQLIFLAGSIIDLTPKGERFLKKKTEELKSVFPHQAHVVSAIMKGDWIHLDPGYLLQIKKVEYPAKRSNNGNTSRQSKHRRKTGGTRNPHNPRPQNRARGANGRRY